MTNQPPPTPRNRTEPRDLPGGHWYYVNGDGSVDIIASERRNLIVVHLREQELRAMLVAMTTNGEG